MKFFIYVLILFLVGAFILKTCSSNSIKIKAAESEVTKAVQNLNNAKDDFKNDVKEFRKVAEQRISNNEVSIAGFNFKLANDKVLNKVIYQQKTNDLDNRNKGMKQRLNDYKGENVITFEPFKTDFNKDMDAIVKAISDFALADKEYVKI